MVVLGLEVAGVNTCQWKTWVTATVPAVEEVAGIEADGFQEKEVQQLEAAGRGRR